MKTHLSSGETILFIGDSITDCQRRDPLHAPLGCGYVRLFHDALVAREPEKSIYVLNRGIGGNTVLDLRNRWHDDVLIHNPDWLSVKIGINDIHRHVAKKLEGEDWLSPTEFHRIFRELLTLTAKQLPKTKFLLVSPFYLSADATPESSRATIAKLLPEYIATIESLRDEFQTLFVPLQSHFKDHLTRRHPDFFCQEPVHPNQTGHQIIAESIFQALC